MECLDLEPKVISPSSLPSIAPTDLSKKDTSCAVITEFLHLSHSFFRKSIHAKAVPLMTLTMDRVAESGLEVKPSTSPEVIPQPDGNMYYVGGGGPNGPVSGQLDQSNPPQAKSPGRSRVIWVLAGIAILCLAVAIGAGLGAGLAAQHTSSSSSSSSSSK